jgi:hypothetical protein
MVTASNGTAIFRGASGRTYSVDFYLADVVGTAVKFDSGSGSSATSLAYWKSPEPVVLTDIAIVTGNTVTTQIVLTSDGAQINGARFRETLHLSTLATRPAINIGFKAGSNIGAIEA